MKKNPFVPAFTIEGDSVQKSAELCTEFIQEDGTNLFQLLSQAGEIRGEAADRAHLQKSHFPLLWPPLRQQLSKSDPEVLEDKHKSAGKLASTSSQ